MDKDKLTAWCIAGAGSVAIHVFIILLFVWSGKSSSVPTPQPASVAAETKAAEPDQPPPDAPRTTAAPTAVPAPVPVTAPAPVTVPAPTGPRTQDYKVKPGDNLTRLARNAGTTPAELARLNGVDEKELAKLKVGQTIKLPAAD